MDLQDWPGIILLIVTLGVLIGVGVMIIDEFGVAAKESTSVVNETITLSSGTATLTNDDVTAFTFFGNGTTDTAAGGLDIGDGANINWTSQGEVYVNTSIISDSKYNVSYTYDADTTTTTALFSARDATDDFVTWFAVIIIVIAASLILGLVMRSFRA